MRPEIDMPGNRTAVGEGFKGDAGGGAPRSRTTMGGTDGEVSCPSPEMGPADGTLDSPEQEPLPMHFQATVRHGGSRSRYHTETLRADDLREALLILAERLPDEVLSDGDLVEIRPVVDPEAREYMGEDGG
ncbi:MAG: hypothetical protein EA351_02520 [Gemmatimonadales bacterium]|nr:MAG: hypothetical protein EA351_02520 [Gemmatimonadales bacterium]